MKYRIGVMLYFYKLLFPDRCHWMVVRAVHGIGVKCAIIGHKKLVLKAASGCPEKGYEQRCPQIGVVVKRRHKMEWAKTESGEQNDDVGDAYKLSQHVLAVPCWHRFRVVMSGREGDEKAEEGKKDSDRPAAWGMMSKRLGYNLQGVQKSQDHGAGDAHRLSQHT